MRRKVIIIFVAPLLLIAGYSFRFNSDSVLIQENPLSGSQLYIKYCQTCHQADGGGVRGMFPPLAGNSKITGSADELVRIVLFGMQGSITVNEREYNQVMPPQGYLPDKQIAGILSHVRNNWGNKAPDIKPEEVSKIRKLGKPKE